MITVNFNEIQFNFTIVSSILNNIARIDCIDDVQTHDTDFNDHKITSIYNDALQLTTSNQNKYVVCIQNNCA